MKEVLTDKLSNFTMALDRLEEALKEEGYSLSLDGTIKRFEFTFEMCWKVIKKFLLFENIDCISPRDCIKKAYQTGFIENENVWLDIMRDRNLSSHMYSELEAKDIYIRIREKYLKEFKKLKESLENKLVNIKE